VELANALGAYPIVAVDVREPALKKAEELGATHIVNASGGDPLSKVREVLPQGQTWSTKPSQTQTSSWLWRP